MANPNDCLGISNPNGETFVDYHTDPVGANNAFSAGVTSGFNVRENDPAGMTVLVGGESGVQDSAIVKSTAGIVYPVGNTTGEAIEITVNGAPATNARIDVIVLSVDTTSTTSELNGYDLVSVDIVEGTAASTPTAPTDSDITSEIGAGKAFIRLAEIRVESGVVAIVNSDITSDGYAKIGAQNIDFATHGVVATTFAWQYNDTQTVDVVSNAGTNLSLFLSLGGVRASASGNKIIATETKASVVCFGGYMNGSIQANGVAGSSTIYTKTVGISGGTTGAYTNNVSSGNWYGTAIALDSNNKTMISLDYRQTKVPSNYQTGDNRWVMDGSFISGGGNGYGNFLIEYTQGVGQGYYTTALSPRGTQTSTSTNLVYTIYEKV